MAIKKPSPPKAQYVQPSQPQEEKEEANLAASTAEVGPLQLLGPLRIMYISAWFFFSTILHLLLAFQFHTFLSIDDFKDEWFARFWAWFGPKSRENAAPAVVPLLQNHARGVCLDIGPGTGQWLYLFQRANNPGITKIYGIEPNAALHKSLRENARNAGLEDVYEIIGCGAEELQARGEISAGSIDTIITVQCLCSIPTPQLIIKNLFPLLKPGGQWLLYEHVKTKYQGDFVAYWQKGLDIIWPHMINGCSLTRPTDQWLLEAGDWDQVQLRPGKGEGRYDTVPHITGTLTKKK